MAHLTHEIGSFVVITYYTQAAPPLVKWFSDEVEAREFALSRMALPGVTYAYVARGMLQHASASLKHRFDGEE